MQSNAAHYSEIQQGGTCAFPDRFPIVPIQLPIIKITPMNIICSNLFNSSLVVGFAENAVKVKRD